MKYFLILLIAGIAYYMYAQSKKSRLKKQSDPSRSEVGKTTVYQTKKNNVKIHLDAEDVEFEEIKNHEPKE